MYMYDTFKWALVFLYNVLNLRQKRIIQPNLKKKIVNRNESPLNENEITKM